MKLKVVSGIILTLLLVSILPSIFGFHPVEADWTWTETIHIRADGSVDPDTAPVSSVDNITYTLTDNIVGDVKPNSIAIVVERDNIIIDGAGYTLQGTGAYVSKGIDLTGRTNVRVQNTQIKNFDFGIELHRCSNNSISENNIANNGYGIWLSSSNYSVVSGNTFTNGGLIVWDSFQNVVEDNTVNGKPLVYLEGVADYTVGDAGQVILINCTGIRVESLNLSQTSIGVQLWETSNSSIADNTIANNREGIELCRCSNNSISENNITGNNGYGIYLWHSSNYNSISGNNVRANSIYGIWLDYSSNNTVSGNDIEGNNEIGILLSGQTNNNSVCENKLTDNGYGICLSSSKYNSICGNNITGNNDYGVLISFASNNSMVGNNIANNGYGIWLDDSSENSISGNTITNNDVGIELDEFRAYAHNRIYHNNFIDNTQQVNMVAPNRTNFWDDGLEGNYWSNYTGVDSNHDGIGDSPHIIDANNTDNYPLMGMFYSINITFLPGSTVTLISNSTISLFNFVTVIESIEPGTSKGIPTIFINFTDQTGYGFCRVSIPHALMNISNTPVTIDHGFTTVLTPNYMLYDNGTQRWIYFAYEQSTPPLNQTSHFPARIMIIPEFPSFLILPLSMLATLLSVIVYKRKHTT